MTPLGAHKPGSENESGVVTLEVGLLRENFGKPWCCATRWDPYVDGEFNHWRGIKFLTMPIFLTDFLTDLLPDSSTGLRYLKNDLRYLKNDLRIKFRIVHATPWKDQAGKYRLTISFKTSIGSSSLLITAFPWQSLAWRNHTLHTKICHFSEGWSPPEYHCGMQLNLWIFT